MITIKQYPTKIYPESVCDIDAEHLENAYRAGLIDGSQWVVPMTAFSNLTQAILGGHRIDWKALDGARVALIEPSYGSRILVTLKYTEIEVNGKSLSGKSALSAIALPSMVHSAFNGALAEALSGDSGWFALLEGEIPVKKRTAAELKYGSIFKGKCPNDETQEFLVAYSAEGGKCLIESDIFKALSEYQPSQVEVVEILSGGFRASKEEA